MFTICCGKLLSCYLTISNKLNWENFIIVIFAIDISIMRGLLALLLILSTSVYSNKTASEIYLDLQKLHSLKRVLYIAAHPDDENTRAIAWFSLGEKAQTAYMSLTRGDGGQNLIGDELSEELGVLRTQELLAARSIDGGRQFFSRAVDFGYSKSATETLEKWGKDQILSDVVRVIRQFKPDVIITRFPPDKRGGHGHHTASAMLAIEAFDKAADENFLPEQVKEFGAWKTSSIYWNTSYWWNKSIADSAKTNDKYFVQDIGGYNSQLGMSFNEIGTLARSQHKCQGFGAIVERGSRTEYFEHLGGKKVTESFFEHNTTSWSTEINEDFENQFNKLIDDFDFVHLENNLGALVDLRKGLESMKPSTIKDEKLALCNEIIKNCLGIYVEITADDYSFVKGDTVHLKLSVLNRSNFENLDIVKIQMDDGNIFNINTLSKENEMIEYEFSYLPKSDLSGPYWLKNSFTNVFTIDDPRMLGKPESDPTLSGRLFLEMVGIPLELEVPVEYKWRIPSYGEKRRDFIATPEFTVNFDEKIATVKPKEEKVIRLKVHAFKENLTDEIHLTAPEGWKVEPALIPVNLKNKHDEKWFDLTLKPSKSSVIGPLGIKNKAGEELYSYKEIEYDHIPTQILMNKTSFKCIPLDVEIIEGKVAYIKGVDDAVPAAIQQLGFELEVFEVNDLATLELKDFQSVVLGIRIYNVYPELANYHEKLWEYVEKGGNVIMQYNTASRSMSNQKFGPIPFELSRNRVTEEDATVEFLLPDHPILNEPNQITAADFDHWVQERGLYFADNWSSEYQTLFSWHDDGEDAQTGAFIVAKYGKGQFIYTGISFFRELPNGVVGAYRLFANMLSYDS